MQLVDGKKRIPFCPAAYSRYGSFDQLQEDNNKRINGILSDLLKNTYPEGSIEKKVERLLQIGGWTQHAEIKKVLLL